MYDGPAELNGHILDLDLNEVVIERCQVDALHLLMTGYEHDLLFEAAVAALGDLRIAGLRWSPATPRRPSGIACCRSLTFTP
jgi:hypothetical protein